MTKASRASTTEKVEALFERGFKAWCENTAITVRNKLGLQPFSPLDPYLLAEKLGVEIWDIPAVSGLSEECIRYLSSAEGDEWSAVTVLIGSKQIILINPSHSLARRSSDLMHELAHIVRQHKASQMVTSDAGYALRSFDERQEAEADWFGGALLLPRTVLAHCTYVRMPLNQILEEYRVSRALYNYRVRMTGVNRQFRRNQSL